MKQTAMPVISQPVDGRLRTIIENVQPQIDAGRFAAKRTVGETVEVTADIYADGHDAIRAVIRYRTVKEAEWNEQSMHFLQNDRWRGSFSIETMCTYQYTVMAWVDHFLTWQNDLTKKNSAGQDLTIDLQLGANIIEEAVPRAQDRDTVELRAFAKTLRKTQEQEVAFSTAVSPRLQELMHRYSDRRLATTFYPELAVTVERRTALFSSWYEFFPRSFDGPGHGTFRDCISQLQEVAAMGFSVVYLPPIHPIGTTNRKGRNNTTLATAEDPGSPWAIGSADGGHTAINPALGTMADFEWLVGETRKHGLELALDLAFQCSPDHPYVKEHPEWFKHRPDGSIRYAENPPKKYEDIVALDFECVQWRALWDELLSVVLFWVAKGVHIFRVDNPHTKPFTFWHWLIARVRDANPDVIFLAEAFTRPKVMSYLAKAGFSQSYTYFTWRNSKSELIAYFEELTQSSMRDYFRPNLWPTTPDILPEYLQFGGRPAFIVRLILAATLSSNYGIYGPAYELSEAKALPNREEYLDSEKYETRQWNHAQPHSLRELVSVINTIRVENPALQETNNLEFYHIDNDHLLLYGKTTPRMDNIIVVVVNLDPYHPQSGFARLPLERLGIESGQAFLMYDLISQARFFWQDENNYVSLDPHAMPAHIFRVHRRLQRETDFDYYL